VNFRLGLRRNKRDLSHKQRVHGHSCGERRQYLHLVQNQIPMVLLARRFSQFIELRSRRLGDNAKLARAIRFRRVMKLLTLSYMYDAILFHVPYLEDIPKIIRRNITFNGLPDSFWNNCIFDEEFLSSIN